MNKKVIKYLILIALIIATLILIPTISAAEEVVEVTRTELNEGKNLFCLNKNRIFGDDEEFSVSDIYDEDFTIPEANVEPVDTDVLKYIISESVSGEYGNELTEKKSTGTWVPQIAIWKLAGAEIDNTHADELIARAYAYDAFIDEGAPIPTIEKNGTNEIAIIYCQTTGTYPIPGGQTGTYTNLLFNTISVTGATYNRTENNGNYYKRIYTKNSNATDVTVSFNYETSRTATLQLYRATEAAKSITYYIDDLGKDVFYKREGKYYHNECNGFNEQLTSALTQELKGIYSNGDNDNYDIDDDNSEFKEGYTYYTCGCRWHLILATDGTNWIKFEPLGTTLNGKAAVVFKDHGNLTPKEKYSYVQNLLYGSGEINTARQSKTIKFGLDITLNKTDSLTGDPLDGAKFKVELTNVSSIDGYQLPTSGATQDDPRTVYVTTDSNGQIRLTGILPNNTSNTISVTITETEAPSGDGCYYKKLENPITITLTYNSSTGEWSKTSGSGTLSGSNLTIDITNKPYIDLSGWVWQDAQRGDKVAAKPDGIWDWQGTEKGLTGVLVELYNVDQYGNITGDRVTYDITENIYGDYQFIGIPKTNNGYKVVFKYDGINYETTIQNVGVEEDIDSDALEQNRGTVNSNIKTISANSADPTKGLANDTVPLSYKETEPILNVNMDGTNPANNNATDFQVEAHTGVYYNTDTNITCGLVKKNFDLAIGTDVKNAKIDINGKTTEYTYAQIMDGALEDLELDEILQNNSSTSKEETKYNLYLYSSDYNYRIDDYKTDVKGNNVPDEDNNNVADYEELENLEAYVTYSVILKNQTTHNATVNEFVYYYDDSVYSPVFSVNNVVDGYKVKSIEGNKITFESADLSNTLTEGNGYRKEIDLTFSINKKDDGSLVVNETATNIAEITKYSTDEGGLIDKDSAPANGITNGQITKYEDDTDEAKGLNIVLRTEETRTITGTVFDDTDKDGKLNNENNGVNDVIVQLIEIKKIGGAYYEYIWQETRSGSNQVKTTARNGYTGTTYTNSVTETGRYEFKDFIPGNYIIRFIYGDGKTYDITSEEYKASAESIKTYNGQDYKSTIDPNYNKAWYNTAGYTAGQSVARDNEARRLEVMTYSSTINGTNGAALANKTTEALEATWMCAETSRINIPVDADNTATDTASTTASYNYTNTNTKVLFGDMNFGLALRPETNIVLEKHITALKITPSGTGVQSIVDAKAESIEAIVNGTDVKVKGITDGLAIIKSTADNRGFWQVATDVEELMQGAQLEVEYTYVLRNDSEEDYLSNTLVEAYENQDIKPYNEILAEINNTVKTAMRSGTYSYSNNNSIGTYLGQFYYTGNKGANDELVSSRVESFEEALNNDLAFDETEATSFKVTEQQVKKPVYGVNKDEGTKESEIETVVQNTTVSTFLTPKLEENHTTETADWSKTITLKTTLSTVGGGKLGANLPSYIAQVLQYSNAAGRKDMIATPANLSYVNSDDTEMTMVSGDNEQDEFWGETIIITKPTGEDKLTPLQIVLITISAVAALGVGIVLIKKFVLKK